MSMTLEEAIELKAAVGRLMYSNNKDVRDYNELIDFIESALRPVSRERIEKVWRGEWIAVREAVGGYKCSRRNEETVLDCNEEFVLDNFCPRCGAAMTDEAVDMVMERLGVLKDGY